MYDYSGMPIDYRDEYEKVLKENDRLRQQLKDALAGQEYASWQFGAPSPQNGLPQEKK